MIDDGIGYVSSLIIRFDWMDDCSKIGEIAP